MIDQERLDTAREILLQFLRIAPVDTGRLPPHHAANSMAFRARELADMLLTDLAQTQKDSVTSEGHPAEVALEQLIALLADHHDKQLPKWIAANAKHRKLGELVSYLGAEVE